jgi:hypothetical protein
MTILDDDLESDRGFARAGGDASGGLWERVAPTAVGSGSTQSQPGADHSPNGTRCWVTDGSGGSATAGDVDGGETVLLSPRFDLSHAEAARVKFWRWYYESLQPGDFFQLQVSNNGGQNWTVIPQVDQNTSTGGWREVSVALHGVLQFTDQMQLRLIARDQTESVVEALVDDFTVEAVVGSSSLSVWSSGAIGTTARLGRRGPAGWFSVLLMSGGTGSFNVPGIRGTFLLDIGSLWVLDVSGYDASGYAPLDLGIPADPSLRGKTVHFQLLNGQSASDLEFGNRTSLDLR